MQYRAKLPIQNPDLEGFAQQSGASRFVFNWGLEQCIKDKKKTGKLPSFNDICSKLPKLKKKEKWLKTADANALQQSLRDLYASINLMFKANAGFPKFKAKKFTQPHFRTCMGIRLNEATIKVGKLGTFKVRRRGKRLDGRLKSISCKQEGNGRWYASLLLEAVDREPLPKKKATCGIDMGSRIFACVHSSTGKAFQVRRPKREAQQLEKIKRLQQTHSRTQKDSNRREKARRNLAKAYFKLQNQRKDFNHKLSRKVVNAFQKIAVENLNVKGLMRTKSAAKGFQQAAIGEFLRMLAYKAEWYGRQFVEVNAAYTSKTCPDCGAVNDLRKQTFKKTKRNRYWECLGCGVVHERDEAAAKNIHQRGKISWAPKVPSLRTHKSSFGKLGSLKREAYALMA